MADPDAPIDELENDSRSGSGDESRERDADADFDDVGDEERGGVVGFGSVDDAAVADKSSEGSVSDDKEDETEAHFVDVDGVDESEGGGSGGTDEDGRDSDDGSRADLGGPSELPDELADELAMEMEMGREMELGGDGYESEDADTGVDAAAADVEPEREPESRFVSFVPGDVAAGGLGGHGPSGERGTDIQASGVGSGSSMEAGSEAEEALSLEKLEELLRLAAEEQEGLQSKNLLLQRKLAQYLSTKKSEEPSGSGEKSMIDMERLYRKNMQRVKSSRQKLAELQSSLDARMLDLKRKLDEREELVSAGTSDLTEFKRQIALSAAHTRTGRPIPRETIQHHEQQEAAKDRTIQLVRLRYITLQQRTNKLETSLKSKEELGDGLHLIDFQQLKIENHSLAEKIEERNEEVLKLRKKITHAVQMLTHLKEKQQAVQNENLELIHSLQELGAEVAEEQSLLSNIKRERDTLRTEHTRMRQESGLMGKVDLLEDFEGRKRELNEMSQRLNALQLRHMTLLGKINALFEPETTSIEGAGGPIGLGPSTGVGVEELTMGV